MNGRDLEKMAQQNVDWAKTGFSKPQPVAAEVFVAEKISPQVGIKEENQEIKTLRSALYLINAHYFSSCKCKGCEPARAEIQKVFHDLDRLIKEKSKYL